jgi:hypothetical protein
MEIFVYILICGVSSDTVCWSEYTASKGKIYEEGTIKKTPWSESASELYRPSDRRFSAKCCQLVRIEGATWSA